MIKAKKEKMQKKARIERLFRRHYGRMLGLARALLHDTEEADDTVQDVFARLLEADIATEDEGYLLTAVRNACLNKIKQRQRRERASLLLPLETDDSMEATEAIARLEAINNIIRRELQEPDLSIMRLRFGEGLSLQATARRLGMSLGAVHAHLTRSIQRVRNELKEQ